MRSNWMGAAVLWLAVVGLGCSVAAMGADRNLEAIAKVKAGELEEARAAWWGFDPQDATPALQAAIASGAKRVIVENMGTPWIVTPIDVASNLEIIFENGVVVEAKKGEFRRSNDSLFNISRKQNVSLIGYGAVSRMHRTDYDAPPYTKAEWRHVINIHSSSNIKIYGLTLAESGGDGIYLGTAEQGVTNKDVHIKDVVCDGNYRQGISVITAENLLIENTILKNTGGTAPQAGIDFEPNHPSERLVNCVMRDCISEDNNGSGYVFYLPNLNRQSAPLSIRFENCVARGTNRGPFGFTTGREERGGAVSGVAEFVNCTFANGRGPAITIRNNPASACRLKFTKCRISDPAKETPETPVILLESGAGEAEDFGGLTFEDCVVEDSVDRPLMKFVDREGGMRLVDITGTLRTRRNGAETVRSITREWLDSLQVGHIYKRFPKYPMRNIVFEPLMADLSDADLKLRPFSVRSAGTFVLHARRGDQVTFRLRQLQVGKYSGNPTSVKALTPSGKALPLGEVPFPQEATFQFQAGETGLYRIPFDCGSNKLEMTSANRLACVSGEEGRIRLIAATGDFFFCVPENTKAFGVRIAGEGEGEAVAATIYDPAGQKVWERPRITAPDQFVATPQPSQTGKPWRLTFARAAGIAMEDFTVELQGIPPFLASSPKALLKPIH